MDSKLRARMISLLRRAWVRDVIRNNVLKKARKSHGMYECSICGEGILHRRKDVQVDHKEPVVPSTGFTSLDDYVVRLFCDESGLWVLCKEHHDRKTQLENEERKQFRKSKPRNKK